MYRLSSGRKRQKKAETTYIRTFCSGTEGGGMERAAIQWEGDVAA
jgi:hypothetical protein